MVDPRNAEEVSRESEERRLTRIYGAQQEQVVPPGVRNGNGISSHHSPVNGRKPDD